MVLIVILYEEVLSEVGEVVEMGCMSLEFSKKWKRILIKFKDLEEYLFIYGFDYIFSR